MTERAPLAQVAVISDVHGNLPALRAVLDDVAAAGVRTIVSCGDLAAGPLPEQTLDYVLAHDPQPLGLRGNADRGMVEAYDGIAGRDTHEDDVWAGRQIDRRHRDALAALPLTLTLTVHGLGRILFCHGTPRRDDEIVLETTAADRVAALLADSDADVVVCGNTHLQFDRRLTNHRLVNPGSVGMPYGGSGANWALLGPDVDLRQSPYDLAAAADEIRSQSEWPRAAEFVRDHVLSRPSRDEALGLFQQWETTQA